MVLTVKPELITTINGSWPSVKTKRLRRKSIIRVWFLLEFTVMSGEFE